ncbi:MAG TPA: riboflavin kinase, partial [Candidatus Peribacteria bacterium]|nr:riboflavin kinase [Candidatus Peribacteria bacterium]
PLLDPPIVFSARTVHGSGRGRGLKVPTINMDLTDVPEGFTHGVYVCRVSIGGKQYDGALHFGPRPVFKDSESLEVHILDAVLSDVPERIEVHVLARIRDVKDFPGKDALLDAIADDIRITRGILKSC